MRPPPAEAHYAKPEGAAGFAMKSFVLPLAAGAVAIICVLLIGHQHGGHLFCLSHPLRLPFVLAKKAIKRCSRGDGEHQKAGSAISALVVLEAGVASAFAMWSVQGSIAVGHHAWYTPDEAARPLRHLVIIGLAAPVAASVLFLLGLFLYGATCAPGGQFIRSATLTEHYAATASLVLMCVMGMQVGGAQHPTSTPLST